MFNESEKEESLWWFQNRAWWRESERGTPLPTPPPSFWCHNVHVLVCVCTCSSGCQPAGEAVQAFISARVGWSSTAPASATACLPASLMETRGVSSITWQYVHRHMCFMFFTVRNFPVTFRGRYLMFFKPKALEGWYVCIYGMYRHRAESKQTNYSQNTEVS